MGMLTDAQVRALERQGEAAELAAYFFRVFAVGSKKEREVAGKQFDSLRPSFRARVNKS